MPKYFSFSENAHKDLDEDSVVYLVRSGKDYAIKAMQNYEIEKCSFDPGTRQLYGLKIANPQNFSEFFENDLLKSDSFSAKSLFDMNFNPYDLEIIYFNLGQKPTKDFVDQIEGSVYFPFNEAKQLGIFLSRFPESRKQIIWDLFDNTYNHLANECLTRIFQNLSSPKQLSEFLDVVSEKQEVILERIFSRFSSDENFKNRLFSNLNISFEKLRESPISLIKKMLLSEEFIKKLSTIDISLDELLRYDGESIQELLDNSYGISHFISYGFTWRYFLELADRKTLLEGIYYFCPEKLIQGNSLLSASFLMSLKASVLYLLLKNEWGGSKEPMILSFLEHGFPAEKLQTIEPVLLQQLLSSGILAFIDCGFTWQYFFASEDQKTFLEDLYYLCPKKLIQSGSLLSASFLMTIKVPILHLILKKTWGGDKEPIILSFLKYGFPINKLQTIEVFLLEDLLDKSHDVLEFIKYGFTWEYFFELNNRKSFFNAISHVSPKELIQEFPLLSASFLMTLNPISMFFLIKNSNEYKVILNKFKNYSEELLDHWKIKDPHFYQGYLELYLLRKLSTDYNQTLDEFYDPLQIKLRESKSEFMGILKNNLALKTTETLIPIFDIFFDKFYLNCMLPLPYHMEKNDEFDKINSLISLIQNPNVANFWDVSQFTQTIITLICNKTRLKNVIEFTKEYLVQTNNQQAFIEWLCNDADYKRAISVFNLSEKWIHQHWITIFPQLLEGNVSNFKADTSHLWEDLKEPFFEKFPSLKDWFNQLSVYNRKSFLSSIFQKSISFENKEAILKEAFLFSALHDKKESFCLKTTDIITFELYNFQKVNLSLVDLKNVRFKDSILENTQLFLNPTLSASHLQTNKIDKKWLFHSIDAGTLLSVQVWLSSEHATSLALALTRNSKTALHLAFETGKIDIAETILRSPYCIPAVLIKKDKQGNTPLQIAEKTLPAKNRARIINLIQCRIFPSAVISESRSSFQIAQDLLRKYSNSNDVTRFFHNRPHTKKILKIIKKIDNNEIRDVPQLLNLIEPIQPTNTVNEFTQCVLIIKKAFERESENKSPCNKNYHNL